jgi:hypothetical protein
MTPPAAEPKTIPAGSSSPTSTPPPAPNPPGITAPALGIRSATPSTPTTGTGYGNGGGSAGGPPPSDPLDESGSTHSDSDGPGREPPELGRLKLGKQPLRDVFRGLMLGASLAAHQRLATTAAEQEAGVWLMDEDEAAGIADPLASIANRHAGDAVINADAADLIAAGVAAAAYLVGNSIEAFKIRWSLRRARRAGTETDQSLGDSE